MSRDQAEKLEPITDVGQLAEWFRASAKGDATLGVGTEHEKFGFDAETLAPLPYEGPRGIGALLEQLVGRGWTPAYDEGHIVALERDGAAVTLEPGGQLELSGRVCRTVQETEAELDLHLDEVRDIGASLGQVWTHLGMNPWDTPDAIPWMPKSRYQVMRRYLATRGSRAHWMMKATCTIQANYDFRTEDDAFDLLRLTTRLSPLVTALFAHTPFEAGAAAGVASARMRVWRDVDPDRCGVPDVYLQEDARFEDLAEWVLDVPLFFVRRGGRYLNVAGRSFRDLLAGRIDDLTPNIGDWELHLSTLFPDVRVKGYLEVRTADAAPRPWILALPALWKGLIYDDTARRDAHALLGPLTAEQVRALSLTASDLGLDGEWGGTRLRELATELVRIAGDGLDRLADGEPTERGYLTTLCDDAGAARAPGEAFAALWETTGGDRRQITEALRLV